MNVLVLSLDPRDSSKGMVIAEGALDYAFGPTMDGGGHFDQFPQPGIFHQIAYSTGRF